MRIKDLATRATKLLAGNSWFAVDNGSKVDKVGYSDMVKEAIEEYNGTSLAGSNQSVKSAVDALNSNLMTAKTWNQFTQPTLENGTHYGNYGCRYARFGSFVVVIISVAFDTPPTNVLLWTMPSNYKPVGGVEVPVSGGGSYNAKAQCTIMQDGNVRVTSVDKWVTGQGIFICGG